MASTPSPKPDPKITSILEIKILYDYVKLLESRKNDQNFVNFYRGHGEIGHTLQPLLFRKPGLRKYEKNLLREIISIHPSEFSSDQGVFEQLVRMQHFSLPTRLLDITNNPLVALYFCCVTKPKSEGEVIRIIVKSTDIKYYDSDTVSCVANLANLAGREQDQLRMISIDKDLLESSPGKRLLQFIKSEKPYFLPEIYKRHLDAPIIVKPRLKNRRLLAQQGAFILFGLNLKLENNNNYGYKIQRLKLFPQTKLIVKDSLDKIGINESVMFPEIESAARYLISKVTPTSL